MAGKCCVRLWWLVLVVLVGIGGSNGFPLEDLVVGLPGQPKVGFRQFAGYIDVDIKAGRSLFYYFVEAEKDPDHKPLTLWLNGGPGCSTIGGGGFKELGPFFPRADGRGLRRNSKSWNKASNLLFVDSPAGVGWSYSNTTPDYYTGDNSTANDMHIFMIKWLEKFPAFQHRDLFLTGESYAGHYIPQLAVALLDHNRHLTTSKFNIKGVALGNPLLRLDRDIPVEYEFLWSHGMISDEIRLIIIKECDFSDYTYGTSDHNVSKKCYNAMEEVKHSVSSYVDSHFVDLDFCYPPIVEQELRLGKLVTKMSLGIDVCINYEIIFYFNLPEVQSALHANRTNLPYNWTACSVVLNYTMADLKLDMRPLLKRIIQNGVRVWVYSGDQDSVVPLMGSRSMIREVAHDLNLNVTVPYGAWFHKGQVGGWHTEYGNMLTFATVRGAGHMVPYSQPARALHLFSSFVHGHRLPNATRLPMDD